MGTPETVAIATGWAWLKAHERLIMLALVLAVGAFGLSKYFDVNAAQKEAKYAAAEQIVAHDKENSAAAATATAQMQSQYTALVQALSAQNASLSAAITARQTAQAVQQATDARLPLSDLATRLQTLGNAPVNSVSLAGNQILLTQPGAVAVTQTLEQVPVLVQNLADETKIAGNYHAEAQKSDLLVGDLHTQVTGLNTQLTDQTKECTLQVAAVKAEARKSKVKFFKWGFITGFISGIYLGHVAGI
jgi:hypothetical protein